MFDPNIEVIKRAVKIDKMRVLPRILSLFRDNFNKCNNTGARLLVSIYCTLKVFKNAKTEKLKIYFFLMYQFY